MMWPFRAARSPESVAEELIRGLEDGSIALDDPHDKPDVVVTSQHHTIMVFAKHGIGQVDEKQELPIDLILAGVNMTPAEKQYEVIGEAITKLNLDPALMRRVLDHLPAKQ